MKRILGLSLLAAAVAMTACTSPKVSDLEKRLEAAEQKIAQLEKRPAMPSRPMPAPQDKAYNVPVGSSPVLGNPNAPVAITIFSDYQCPFCAKTDPLLAQAVKDPELKDKVKVVFKHFPLSFHPNARPAAKAALAAGEQGKFWEMTAKLYDNQQSLSPENYSKWAKELGLNTAKFENDLKNNDAKYEDVIKNDSELGTKEASVRGTPTILVGGWELQERSVDGIKNLLKDKKLVPAS